MGIARVRVGAVNQAVPEYIERHRGGLQRAVTAKLVALLDRVESPEPCRRALATVVAAAIDFGLASMDSASPDELEIPSAVLSHARAAARVEIPLEQVMRAYASGYSAFVEHALAVRAQPSSAAALAETVQTLAAQFDRLVNAVVSEYAQAVPGRNGVAASFQTRLIQKLLKGEHVDTTALPYDFGGWHMALMLERGAALGDDLRAIARGCNVRVLIGQPGDSTTTVWFGSTSRAKLDKLLVEPQTTLQDLTVAAGEPSRELAGWQLTYRQAESIWPYVQDLAHGIYRYAEAGLLAAIAFNPVLARSMRSLYVEPLGPGPDGETSLVETVRAYLDCGRNASSAAARLGLSRQTVRNRLRAAEERLGRSIEECGAEVEIALRLDQSALAAEKTLTIC